MQVTKVGYEARAAYGSNAMCCSEAVLTVINAEFDGGLPQNLVIALSKGFCGGIGDAGCICGALAGAVMAQSLILGKGPQPADDARVRALSKELHDRFVSIHGSACCRVLSEDRDHDSESKGPCLEYVESAASICARLLLEPAPPGLSVDSDEDPAAAHAALMKRLRRERKASKTVG